MGLMSQRDGYKCRESLGQLVASILITFLWLWLKYMAKSSLREKRTCFSLQRRSSHDGRKGRVLGMWGWPGSLQAEGSCSSTHRKQGSGDKEVGTGSYLKASLYWHTSSSKSLLLKVPLLLKQCHLPRTKHSNIWAYGGQFSFKLAPQVYTTGLLKYHKS